MRLVQRKGCAHGRFGRVGRRLVKNRHRHAGQCVQRLLQDTRRFNTRVGHDEGALDLRLVAFRSQACEDAEVDFDRGDIEDFGHGTL